MERSAASAVLEMDVTTRCDELLRDERMTVECRDMERRVPFLCLEIDVTARCNELFRDGRMAIKGGDVEGRASKLVLVVDEKLRGWRRQERRRQKRPHICCITMTGGSSKLLRFALDQARFLFKSCSAGENNRRVLCRYGGHRGVRLQRRC